MYIKLFLRKQLTINKCTLLDCTNTEILMHCIYLQYTPSVRYYLHTLFWYRHTYMTFLPCFIVLGRERFKRERFESDMPLYKWKVTEIRLIVRQMKT